MYETDIVTVDNKKGIITLDNGGWFTRTTKDKMNQILNEIFCNMPDITISRDPIFQNKGLWYYKSTMYPYFNGIKINIITEKILNPKQNVHKEKEKLIKLINAYCKKLKALKTLPMPDNGDCWDCRLFEQAKFKNNDHLLLHLKEKYIMGSLILNALKRSGYNDPMFILNLGSRNINRDLITRAVKAYFKDRLGIAR